MWIISISQIIKEINSSDGRFNRAMCENPGERLTAQLVDCGTASQAPGFSGGLYAIPDEQQRIDEIVNQSNGSLESLGQGYQW